MNILKKFIFGSFVFLSSFVFTDVSLSGNVGLTTDYIWRGMTQNDSNPSINGGFDLEDDSGFYLGVWAANVEADDDDTIAGSGSIELDGVNGTYTPNLNFIGTDSFTYIATSTNGQSNIGLVQVTVSRDENNFELIFSIENRGFESRDFAELIDGSIVIGGIAENYGGFINQQTYLIGLNSSFEEIWRKYTGPTGNSTYMKKIKSTADGGFIVFGLHESSFYLE